MIKRLLKSVREFKKDALLTPFFVVLEVVMEVIIQLIMALLIVGGLALLALATTFASGMDEPGTRVSSASVQIVGSVMLTIGVLGILYGAYIIWQIQPGLAMSAEWTNAGAYVSTALLTAAVSALVLGITLAMRQLTASPLTKLGLVGAPPAPPKR